MLLNLTHTHTEAKGLPQCLFHRYPFIHRDPNKARGATKQTPLPKIHNRRRHMQISRSCLHVDTICAHMWPLSRRPYVHKHGADSETGSRGGRGGGGGGEGSTSINAPQMGVNPLLPRCDYCFLRGPCFLSPILSSSFSPKLPK